MEEKIKNSSMEKINKSNIKLNKCVIRVLEKNGRIKEKVMQTKIPENLSKQVKKRFESKY